MSSNPSSSRLKEIDAALGLHEIVGSVRQLSYMKQHCSALLATLNVKLEVTYAKAPIGRRGKGQTYKLQRTKKLGEIDASERERWLEMQIREQWNFQTVAQHRQPFLSKVCDFIQSYQVPLQGTRKDKQWGKIDLIGATEKALPIVIELKQEKAKDTPLRMLVEALAYACAVRKAWNEAGLRAEWKSAMIHNGLELTYPQVLSEVPLILLAPSKFWQQAVGSPGKRSQGKVAEDAWPLFWELVRQCESHGFPIHLVEFDVLIGDDPKTAIITNIASVSPGRNYVARE